MSILAWLLFVLSGVSWLGFLGWLIGFVCFLLIAPAYLAWRERQ